MSRSTANLPAQNKQQVGLRMAKRQQRADFRERSAHGRRLAMALAMLLFFLLSAVIQTPWTALAGVAEWACQQRCALVHGQGSLWHGVGDLVRRDESGNIHPVLTLRWDWQAHQLGNGLLAWSLHDAFGGSLDLKLGIAGLQLESRGLQLPADVLAAALSSPLPMTPKLDGWLQLDGALTCPLLVDTHGTHGTRGTHCAGDSRLAWNSARIDAISANALGDYQVAVTVSRQQVEAVLKTQRGPLWLTGSGMLSLRAASRSWHFSGEAWAEGEDKSRLDAYLHPLGPKDAVSDRYQWTFGNR